ncbi:MAG TPA: hypothetical protein VHR86_06695, partial [Armatimonadota bacterium]|nr:hypothetical protein [Armatimonadota bacterium]
MIVSSVFPPEPLTSGRTSQDLALGLLAAGHRVTVIAGFPTRPTPTRYGSVNPVFRKVEHPAEG